MKPASFIFHRASSLDDALALLAQHPEAKPLAGGQSLIPAMNFRLALPPALVDLNRVTELAGITAHAGGLRVGAMTRHVTVERSDLVRKFAPLLAETMPHVAHPQIRSRGTLGGSLAHADPSAELPAVMVALDATFVLKSRTGERRVKATEFFTGLFETALAKGELLTAVDIPPRAARSGSSFIEVARRHGDYALAGAATELSLDGGGNFASVRLALLSVGDGPVLARSPASLIGQSPTPEAIRAVADAVMEEIDPPGDIHAESGYRKQLAGVLTRRTLTLAVQRASQ
ncbi:MAG TPA: xanthine dehydrogenase family protein subunit M [Gemmatimonadaceae bacterium]|jgi:carbon-monoxide dehydrogenase medium subunit